VLVLGWEFPPFIAGGLGTACHGLTKALDRHGTHVTFVLPKPIDRSHSSHVNLLSPSPAGAAATSNEAIARALDESAATGGALHVPAAAAPAAPTTTSAPAGALPFAHVRFLGVPAGFVSPYQRSAGNQPVGRWVIRSGVRRALAEHEAFEPGDVETEPEPHEAGQSWVSPVSVALPGADYGGDLLEQVYRFRAFCLEATRNLNFDVVHAHDWMTYPAGLAIAGVTGKPLVVHIHSTEFDRSGVHVNQKVYDIERRGMHGAMRVLAVSQLTKNVVMRRYSVPDAKVSVVYNGVDLEPTQGEHNIAIQSRDKIVLYFGRITYQKGPEYFIHAARRVLEYMDNVKFVVAGSGDQAARMIEMAAHMGIGHKVLFTGFLRGRDIKRVFALADLYVMPSVSEPFGIAPLEAMGHDVPVLISKSSGVSEVLIHALKCDFWDIDDMANKIIAVLRHPPLSATLTEHGSFEVRKITWDGAAAKCERVYRSVIDEMTHRMQRQA
jgi:glycosyltransferase involved in cell wall biosynthesis